MSTSCIDNCLNESPGGSVSVSRTPLGGLRITRTSRPQTPAVSVDWGGASSFTERAPRESKLDPENLARKYKMQVSMLASMGNMAMFLVPPPAVAATAEFTRDTGVATVAPFRCCDEDRFKSYIEH